MTTKVSNGKTGTWLIDPTDFTIAASGGDVTGAALSSQLNSSNVTIQSTSGVGGTNGDILIKDTVNWNNNDLTLDTQNNIVINSAMTGTNGGLNLNYGLAQTNSGNSANYTINAPFSVSRLVTQVGFDGALIYYSPIGSNTDLNNWMSAQSVASMGATNYFLTNSIDLSSYAMTPI